MKKIVVYLACLICFGIASAFLSCANQSSTSKDSVETEREQSTGDGTWDEEVGDDYGQSNAPKAKSKRPKPSVGMMQIDLIGRYISDNNPDGYRDRNWRWRIDDGEIKEFRILETPLDNESTYVTVAQVVLNAGGNYSYDTKLKLIYRNSPRDGWKLDSVSAISIKLISDGTYDDCITIEKTSDLYGEHWYISNNCDAPLGVYYRTLSASGWKKHFVTVKGNSQTKASPWSLKDCVIDYVTRD